MLTNEERRLTGSVDDYRSGTPAHDHRRTRQWWRRPGTEDTPKHVVVAAPPGTTAAELPGLDPRRLSKSDGAASGSRQQRRDALSQHRFSQMTDAQVVQYLDLWR